MDSNVTIYEKEYNMLKNWPFRDLKRHLETLRSFYGSEYGLLKYLESRFNLVFDDDLGYISVSSEVIKEYDLISGLSYGLLK